MSGPGDDVDRIECLECGERYRALASHLARKHHLSTTEYRERHGLPRSVGLTGAATRETMRQIGERRRDADPRVLSALSSRPAREQRVEPWPNPVKREATLARIAEARRSSARQRLDASLAEHGWPHLATAVAWARTERVGWTGLARRLGVGHTWLQRLGETEGHRLPAATRRQTVSERMLDAARAYARTHGGLDVPASWCSRGGDRLGRWLVSRRELSRRGRRSWVSDALDAIDPRWPTYGRGARTDHRGQQ